MSLESSPRVLEEVSKQEADLLHWNTKKGNTKLMEIVKWVTLFGILSKEIICQNLPIKWNYWPQRVKNKGFNCLGVEEDARWLRDLANGASVVGSIITEEDKGKFSKIQVIVEEFVK